MIPIPQKNGEIISWAEQASREFNALMPMGPARMLVREGAGGVGCEPLPQNLRDRKAAATKKPFDIEMVSETDEDTGEDTVTRKIVRCVFYRGKEKVELQDFALDDIPEEGEGHVYLVMTEPEGQSATFSLSTEAGTGDGVTNYLLYDFEDGKVTCDYRTTFLVICGGGGSGGGGEVDVAVDDKSVAKLDDGKLEIKGYNDLTNTQSASLVQIIAAQSSQPSMYEMIERDRETAAGVTSPTAVKYRKIGRFYAGADTNITFTPDNNGGVAINVYYK